MEILHVSDLHSRTPWFNWLAAEAHRFGLICVAGDILNLGDLSSEIDQEIDAALKHLAAVKTPLAMCSGNHDVHDLSGRCSAGWMRPLRRKNVWIDGDAFWFFGYRFRCIGWCEPVPQGTERDIFLMHAPPFGAKTSMVLGGVSHGDEEARSMCLDGGGPFMALGGHVHRPLDFSSLLGATLSLNPGQGDNPECPNHIIIDLSKRTMTHHKGLVSGMVRTERRFAK